MTKTSKHILVADDHGVVRYGAVFLIKEMFPEANVLQAEGFKDVLNIVNKQYIDLLVLDINIPGGTNTKMLDTLKSMQPDIKVLIFSAYDEQLYAIRYIQAGAKGYLHKQSWHSDIKIAINTVLKGENYISQTVKDSLLDNAISNKEKEANPLNKLSNRELEVSKLLIEGLGISEISNSLNLQMSTVSTYKNRILEKLNVPNVVQLLEVFRLYEEPVRPLKHIA
jgi:two-component system invasion response regulator UvrY